MSLRREELEKIQGVPMPGDEQLSDKTKTRVIFRKWPDGTVLALMPDLPWDFSTRLVASYQHVGQHGAAEFFAAMAGTVPASPAEYRSLFEELVSVGYEPEVEGV